MIRKISSVPFFVVGANPKRESDWSQTHLGGDVGHAASILLAGWVDIAFPWACASAHIVPKIDVKPRGENGLNRAKPYSTWLWGGRI